MTKIFILLLCLILGGGCVTSKKCLDKFGRDTTHVVVRDTIPVTFQILIPPDSLSGSISADSLGALLAGTYMASKINQQNHNMQIEFWYDKYQKALRYKAKAKRDTVEVIREVPVEVIADCPPAIAQDCEPKGLRKAWRGFQATAGWLVLGGIAFIIGRAVLKRILSL
jgi:hypothetical protein